MAQLNEPDDHDGTRLFARMTPSTEEPLSKKTHGFETVADK